MSCRCCVTLSRGYNCSDSFSINYYFASGNADSVQSGDGRLYDGGFKDELFYVVKGPCIKDSLKGFVLCLNGWNSMDVDGVTESLGSYSSTFTVTKGKGINYYIWNYEDAINFAEKHGVKVFVGETYKPENEITYQKAREIGDAKTLDYIGQKGFYSGSIEKSWFKSAN